MYSLYINILFHYQFISVTQSCQTLCDPMNCSTPGLPVHHQLPEFTQTHVHYRLLQNTEYILCARSKSLLYSTLTFAFFVHACSVTQSRATLWDPMDCSPPRSSVHGISQVRILEWVAFSLSRGSSRPRDRTCISCMGRRVLYHWATWEGFAFFLKIKHKFSHFPGSDLYTHMHTHTHTQRCSKNKALWRLFVPGSP